MRHPFRITALFALVWVLPTAARASSYENPILGYTHLLPSPYTLPAGKLVLGTNVALGMTDFLQVGTDVLYDFYKIYNATAKISLLDFPGFSMGLTGAVQYYNLQNIDSRNPNVQITSYLPGIVAGVALTPTLGVLAGGNFNFSSQSVSSDSLVTSGYTRGADIETDVSWAPYTTAKGRAPIVLSAGPSYDFTYGLVGIGASIHFRGIHVGAHYYPGATQNKVLPIIAGGAVFDF